MCTMATRRFFHGFPRGLCGDLRVCGDLTKVPQVFRNPGGSPALHAGPLDILFAL
jgi:hypothetical protein